MLHCQEPGSEFFIRAFESFFCTHAKAEYNWVMIIWNVIAENSQLCSYATLCFKCNVHMPPYNFTPQMPFALKGVPLSHLFLGPYTDPHTKPSLWDKIKSDPIGQPNTSFHPPQELYYRHRFCPNVKKLKKYANIFTNQSNNAKLR